MNILISWIQCFSILWTCVCVCVCVPEEREWSINCCMCCWLWRILVTYRRSFSQWQDCQWWRIAWLGTTAACFVMARLAKHVENVSSLCVMHIRIKDFLHLLEIVWWVVHACVSLIPWVGGRRVVAKHIRCSETLLTLTAGQVMIGAWLHVFSSISLPKFTWYEWQVFSFAAIPWAALVCTVLSCCKKSGWTQLSRIYSQVTEEHHYVAGWRMSQAWESEVYLQVLFPGDLQWADHWLAWTIIYKSAGKESDNSLVSWGFALFVCLEKVLWTSESSLMFFLVEFLRFGKMGRRVCMWKTCPRWRLKVSRMWSISSFWYYISRLVSPL